MLIYLLCIIWILIDLINLYINRTRPTKITPIIITIIMLVAACLFLNGTYKLYKMSPDIIFAEQMTAEKIEKNPWLQKKMVAIKALCQSPLEHKVD